MHFQAEIEKKKAWVCWAVKLQVAPGATAWWIFVNRKVSDSLWILHNQPGLNLVENA